MSVRLKIISAIQQIAAEQRVDLPPLEDDLSLHETGFDSLAFAILVARLEDDLGVDPFTISADASFPLTIGDFVRAYENVPAWRDRARLVDTELTQSLGPEQKQRIAGRSALRRLPEVGDVARMVGYLLGEGGRNITGAVLTVDIGNTP